MAKVAHLLWTVFPLPGVCATLATQDRTVRTNTSHVTLHPASMMGSVRRWMPSTTSVGVPQVSECHYSLDHQNYHQQHVPSAAITVVVLKLLVVT